MDLQVYNDFIARQKWINAKTYPRIPHEYIVKDRLTEDDKLTFVEFVLHIRQCGVTAKFFSRSYCYLLVGDYYYWTMGDTIENTIILNRASTDKYEIRNGVMYVLQGK